MSSAIVENIVSLAVTCSPVQLSDTQQRALVKAGSGLVEFAGATLAPTDNLRNSQFAPWNRFAYHGHLPADPTPFEYKTSGQATSDVKATGATTGTQTGNKTVTHSHTSEKDGKHTKAVAFEKAAEYNFGYDIFFNKSKTNTFETDDSRDYTCSSAWNSLVQSVFGKEFLKAFTYSVDKQSGPIVV